MKGSIICFDYPGDMRDENYYVLGDVVQDSYIMYRLSFEGKVCYLNKCNTRVLITDVEEYGRIIMVFETIAHIDMFLKGFGIQLSVQKLIDLPKSNRFVEMLKKRPDIKSTLTFNK
jgi:hypothetical protein